MLSKTKVKYIQSLGQKKFRDKEQLFIAEGPKLFHELIDSGKMQIKEIFAVKDWMDANEQIINKVACTEITEEELQKISQLSTANKIIALVHQPEKKTIGSAKGKIAIALDAIRDPGNLGTIIRIADWFGISEVVCSSDCADVYNPKVVQATMGSIARVSVHYTDMEEWLASQKNISIYAAALNGADIAAHKKIKEGIIVIGNEAQGISANILRLCTEEVTIKRKGHAESLNAAVATGIILSHLI